MKKTDKKKSRKKQEKRRREQRRETVRNLFVRLGMKIPDKYLTKDEMFVRQAAKGLTRQDIVIDLGAHVGMASVQFSHTAGRVYAFEPHPVIFEELSQAARRYRRIIPINAAAGTEDGSAHLFSDQDPRPLKHTEGSSLIEGKSNLTYENYFEVKTLDLANFIIELNKPVRMIKMDVEGYEYRLINHLIDENVMDRVAMVHVEDHCDRVENLSIERDATLAKIQSAALSHKFNFEWV